MTQAELRDDEPITEDWWMTEFGGAFVEIDSLFNLWRRSADGVVVLDGESAGRGAPVYTRETTCRTRGDVRRLLELLGYKYSGQR